MSDPVSFRTRFAPSPTGYLHLGHARSAWETFSAARREKGTCLLRIEDIDQTRCRPEFEAAIYEDLSWLGFEWPEPVRRQSDHFEDYQAALDQLKQLGLVYPCFLTRKQMDAALEAQRVEMSPAGEVPYFGPDAWMSEDEIQNRLAKGETCAWRLSLVRARDHLGDEYQNLTFIEAGYSQSHVETEIRARPDWLGDVVLARKDTPTSYHMAVCHDDNLQRITHVVRGMDLYHATHIHVLLQRLMGWHTPVYVHHELVLDDNNKKLSKSRGSKTLRQLRADGINLKSLLASWSD